MAMIGLNLLNYNKEIEKESSFQYSKPSDFGHEQIIKGIVIESVNDKNL